MGWDTASAGVTQDSGGGSRVSNYGKAAAPGDTPLLLDSAGRLILSGLGPAVPTATGTPTTPLATTTAISAASSTPTLVPAAAGVTSYLSGLVVTTGPAAAAAAGHFIINNLATGSFDLQLVETTAGLMYAAMLPFPLAASAPNTAITLTVPAITGGGSGYVVGIGHRQ